MYLLVTLLGHTSNSDPTAQILINGEIKYDGTVIGTQDFEYEVADNTSVNTLEIVHYGKLDEHTVVDNDYNIIADRSVELKSVKLNKRSVLETVLYNSPYRVIWPEGQRQSATAPLPDTIKSLYFGYNGTWSFEFYTNTVKQNCLEYWLDEAQAHNNLTKISDGQAVFERFGIDVSIKQELDLTIFDLEKMIQEDA